ncbi:MAG TPA: cytochrome C [Paracoccaceae bacterium]|nr:cytochrome C [Paracoccaceae bacterium]
MKLINAIATTAVLFSGAIPAFAEGDVAAGEDAFKKCKACHSIVDGDNVIVKGGKSGPNLYGVIGRVAGSDDFKYSKDLAAAGVAGLEWDEVQLAAFITDPKAFLQTYLDDSAAKSKMTFKLKSGGEDVAAYLASLAE